MTIIDDEKRIFCPKCKRVVIKLISITDDGKGIKICRNCKRRLKKENPELDFSKMKEVKKQI